MQLNIRGDKLVITDAIKQYAEEKLGKLDKYFEDSDSISCHVLIKGKARKQIIEVTIPIKQYTLRAEEVNDDLYAAIDTIVDKLERQIRKNKTRIHNKFKQQNIKEMNLAFETEEDTTENKIVKRKTLEMKPMDEEEAILQMDLLGHDFFIFQNVKKDNISVVYRRKDGNYGIIETNE